MQFSCRGVLGASVALLLALWIGRRTAPKLTENLPPEGQAYLKKNVPALAQLLFDMGEDSASPASKWARPAATFTPGSKRHPVVVIPGFISCGLEVWKARPCMGEGFFRRKIWGDFSMAEAILQNWTCWLEHIALDPITGVDKEGIKVRAATGLRSSDYFIGAYWLWAKLIQNLGDIGYEEKDMHLACYDWRVAYPLMEERDHYFSSLRHKIESMVQRSGEKVVLVTHSMGATVGHYFMNFVEEKQQSKGWVNSHIESIVSLGGSYLGAMSPLTAFISGEMDATAALGPMGGYIEKMAITWDEIRDIYWSFGGLAGLLPKGGTPVWGSSADGFTDSPVDVVEEAENRTRSLEFLMSYAEQHENAKFASYKSFQAYRHLARAPSVDGVVDERDFANPLASPLPVAPDLKIYCLYGVGLPTERAYKYTVRQVRWAFVDTDTLSGRMWSSTKPMASIIEELRGFLGTESGEKAVRVDAGSRQLIWPRVAEAIEGLETIAKDISDAANPEQWTRLDVQYSSPSGSTGPWGNSLDGVFENGVAKTDGDGTVPLLSLGYMCGYGWRDFPELNPGNVSVYVKELQHQPCSVFEDPRGGPKTGKHVEVIGNSEVISDIMRVATESPDHADLKQDVLISQLPKFGPKVTQRLKQFYSNGNS